MGEHVFVPVAICLNGQGNTHSTQSLAFKAIGNMLVHDLATAAAVPAFMPASFSKAEVCGEVTVTLQAALSQPAARTSRC